MMMTRVDYGLGHLLFDLSSILYVLDRGLYLRYCTTVVRYTVVYMNHGNVINTLVSTRTRGYGVKTGAEFTGVGVVLAEITRGATRVTRYVRASAYLCCSRLIS